MEPATHLPLDRLNDSTDAEFITREPTYEDQAAGGEWQQTRSIGEQAGARHQKLNYASVRANDGARIHNGDFISHHYYADTRTKEPRILKGSRAGRFDLPDFFGDDEAQHIHSTVLRLRNTHQARRESPSPTTLQQKPYTPYTSVKNRTIRSTLTTIATRFQTLDRGFAELFRNYVPSAYRSNVNERLVEIRESIAKQQSHDPDGSSSEASGVYLGDLGQFCERHAACWSQEDAQPVTLIVFSGPQKRFFHYLEDAHEVPYWRLMLEIFLAWKGSSKGDFAHIVLRMLSVYKLDVLSLKHRLLKELGNFTGDEAEQIGPILQGIDDRIKVLEEAWDSDAALLEDSPLLEALFKSPAAATPVQTSEALENQATVEDTTQTVILIALIILFLIGSIIPGYKAFAIAIQSKSPGSIGDADFWNLFQSTIMTILANVVTIVPLMKESWLSPAYTLMYSFLALGTACAIVSLVIYPFCNPAWSSVIGFAGTVLASVGVLIMTQATGKKMRQDGEVKKNQ